MEETIIKYKGPREEQTRKWEGLVGKSCSVGKVKEKVIKQSFVYEIAKELNSKNYSPIPSIYIIV